MAEAKFAQFKLMATYAYGYGFTAFLVHNSLTCGANLLWTVLWITITEMYAKRGYLPEELHIQLDNCFSENKNNIMIAMCAWLVATFKFRRVRVFFLHKGHTHVIIDQVFGVITTFIKYMRIVTVEDLCRCIDESMLQNPQYEAKAVRELRSIYDFSRFVKDEMGGTNTLSNHEDQSVSGESVRE